MTDLAWGGGGEGGVIESFQGSIVLIFVFYLFVIVCLCAIQKGGSYCETAPQSTSTIEASQGSGKPASGATSGASAQDPSAPSHDSHSHCLTVMM